MSTKRNHKPNKPYPSFPLTPHPNGQWCKKILGKLHFFGTWADPKAAHDRYLAVAPDLHAGRTPQPEKLTGGDLTVKDACNAFLNWQKEKLDSGEIGGRWFEDCRSILKEFAERIGKHRPVSDLMPSDFQGHRAKLSRRLGVYALRRHITAIKSVFKYAYDMGLIEQPMRFGRGLDPPSASQERKAKQKAELANGKKLFTREEMLRLLDTPKADELQAATLLGINGGFGNTDCALLPKMAIDLDAGFITYARPKTGVQRVVPLWQETIAAIERVLSHKPKPENEDDAKLVFLTPRGKPLVRQVVTKGNDEGRTASVVDKLGADFSALLKSLKIKRRRIGFYTLRHTFRTWADETHDQHAIHRIMGHAIPGMSGIYVEDISLQRLRQVVDHVHDVLWR
ncbi:MAG: tyrosine-type recombinase/integrase [Planctomycetes bacterium]|nr:tyrosine-type recombinase/integrase [Planctomycetota bacterium]